MTFDAPKIHKMCVFSTTTSFYKLQTTSNEFPNHRLPMAANSLNFRYFSCHAGDLMTFDAPKIHKMCVFSTTTSCHQLKPTSIEFTNPRLPVAANSLNFRYFSCHAGELMTFDAPKIHKMCVFSTTTSCHQLKPTSIEFTNPRLPVAANSLNFRNYWWLTIALTHMAECGLKNVVNWICSTTNPFCTLNRQR